MASALSGASSLRTCECCGREFSAVERPTSRCCGKSCTAKISHAEKPRVRQSRDVMERFWEKVDRRGPSECWPWTAGNTLGYGKFGITRRKCIRATRFLWESLHGPIPSGMFICHSCDNPPCCNPNHLFLGTPKDNVADMVRKGRSRNQYSEASSHVS